MRLLSLVSGLCEDFVFIDDYRSDGNLTLVLSGYIQSKTHPFFIVIY